MKGLSVKRIAALAAGAAILGASVAVADVTFGNTQIVNQNGQPVVKVVVGEKAAASDGVVAANIAAMIGNKAYSKQTISATLSGTATCSVTGGSGAGTCPVSNEKVTLEVTLPGVVSGSASFKTYVNDYVDKYTEDRMTSPAGVGNNYSTSTEIKPCFNLDPTLKGQNVTTSSPEVADASTGAQHGRKITGSDFPALATTTVRDTYAGKTYTEEQSIWVYGSTVYDETGKTVVADRPNVAYKVDFTQDTYGLPRYSCNNYCDPSVSGCTTCSTTDETARHRVSIKFLGEDWIISDMTAPTLTSFSASTSGNVATRGDSGTNAISLAKESAYGIVHIGENLSAGAYSVKLADIGLATDSSNIHKAAIEIYDANGVLVKEDQVTPGTGTYSWTAPDGSKLKIHVYQTQPGYTLASKWAEIAIYGNELTLTDGSKLDNVDNPLWYPYLYWSKDPNNNNVPTLKSMILIRNRNDATTMNLKLNKGDSVPLITTPSKFQMSFDGLGLGSADYDSLSVLVTTGQLGWSTDSCLTSTSTGDTKLLQVTTGISNGFTVSGSPISTFYIDLNSINSSGAKLYYQPSGSSCYSRLNVTNSSSDFATYNLGDGVIQTFDMVRMEYAFAAGTGNLTFRLEERASSTTDDTDKWYFDLDNVTDSAWAFTVDDKGKYKPAVTTGPAYTSLNLKSVDPGYVSERGSVLNGVSSKTVSLSIAKKIGEATYFVSTVGAAPSGATEIVLAEGEEQTLAGGVKIKATSITETVGSCTVGTGGACKVDMSPVSAVLNSGEASVDAITSYKVGDLVVLDNQAGSAAVLISVGGPMVNEVTKQALGGSSTLAKSGDVVVKEVGNVIVVAGYTSQDTMDAGKQFISQLQSS